jgi:hypothetical protein
MMQGVATLCITMRIDSLLNTIAVSHSKIANISSVLMPASKSLQAREELIPVKKSEAKNFDGLSLQGCN